MTKNIKMIFIQKRVWIFSRENHKYQNHEIWQEYEEKYSLKKYLLPFLIFFCLFRLFLSKNHEILEKTGLFSFFHVNHETDILHHAIWIVLILNHHFACDSIWYFFIYPPVVPPECWISYSDSHKFTQRCTNS